MENHEKTDDEDSLAVRILTLGGPNKTKNGEKIYMTRREWEAKNSLFESIEPVVLKEVEFRKSGESEEIVNPSTGASYQIRFEGFEHEPGARGIGRDIAYFRASRSSETKKLVKAYGGGYIDFDRELSTLVEFYL